MPFSEPPSWPRQKPYFEALVSPSRERSKMAQVEIPSGLRLKHHVTNSKTIVRCNRAVILTLQDASFYSQLRSSSLLLSFHLEGTVSKKRPNPILDGVNRK